MESHAVNKKRTFSLNARIDLTKGPIIKNMVAFILPLFIGQLLQQMYTLADAWVIGNFADNDAFAAVSSAGSIVFLIIGFFNGMAIGGGVIISKYLGAQDRENVEKAVSTNFIFGIVSSLIATLVGLLLVPPMLSWMHTPESVLPAALTYFRIYFAGVSTVILYNIGMAIMRALGDSVHPLIYLIISSVVNMLLDLLFVAVFRWGVAGAAAATVISQFLSCLLCIIKMCRADYVIPVRLKKGAFSPALFSEVLRQGLPSGIQNSVISIGNIVVQSYINGFGAYAMSGRGAYTKIEGFAFLPITSISMSLPTFVSQNVGAGQFERAKKGANIFLVIGVVLAELVGIITLLISEGTLQLFISEPEAIAYGVESISIVAPFYFLLSYSHCSAGILRGYEKSFIPMVTMLAFWCGLRILYISTASLIFPYYATICWAYPLTWTCSTIVFTVSLIRTYRSRSIHMPTDKNI